LVKLEAKVEWRPFFRTRCSKNSLKRNIQTKTTGRCRVAQLGTKYVNTTRSCTWARDDERHSLRSSKVIFADLHPSPLRPACAVL